MTKRSQAIVVGALLGAVCSASLGLLGLLLTQDLNELADPVGWAILAALILGGHPNPTINRHRKSRH